MRCWPVLLVCPFMTGCLGYCYPSVMQTPPIAVEQSDVKAFRVTRDRAFFGCIIAGSFIINDAVEDLPIVANEVPAQRDSYLASGYVTFPFLMGGDHVRSVCVQLYRRGNETITIEPRSSLAECFRKNPIEVVWKKAVTLKALEKAIDDLNRHSAQADAVVSAFLVEEYTHLAENPLADDKSRERLLENAKEIRERKQLTGSR